MNQNFVLIVAISWWINTLKISNFNIEVSVGSKLLYTVVFMSNTKVLIN